MPNRCCVPYCKSGYVPTKGRRVTLFQFPKDKTKKEAWVKAINREDFTPTNRSLICIKHFYKHDIKFVNYHGKLVLPLKNPKLHPNAFPSIFTRKECDRTPDKRFCNEDPLETGIIALEESSEETPFETASEIYVSTLPETEPIVSYADFLSSLKDQIMLEYNDSIKLHQEQDDIYLYQINISNFTISRYIRISKDLWGHFYRDSINLPELDQQFGTWIQFRNAVQDFFIFNSNVEDNLNCAMVEESLTENQNNSAFENVSKKPETPKNKIPKNKNWKES